MWENTALTNKGKALQSKLTAGNILKITNVKSGAGRVSVLDIRDQTAVQDIKQELTLQPMTVKNNRVELSVLLENVNLKESYELWQVGIYAEDPDEGEILYCLAQASEGKIIPSATESPGFSITWNFHFKVSDGEKIDMQIEPAGLVSVETFNQRLGKMNEGIELLNNHALQKDNPHGVTKGQLGLGAVENKSGAVIRGEMTAAEVNNALGYIAAKQSEVTQLSSDLLEKVYPVGAVYFSVIDKNPGILFGGTWERFAKGQTIIGVNESDNDFGSVKKTGGNKTHVHSTNEHTLTTDEIPAHSHSVNTVNISSSGSHGHTTYYLQDNSAGGSSGRMGTSGNHTKERTDMIKSSGTHTHTVPAHNTNSIGKGGSHNHGNTGSTSNLSPYITTYIWTRIA